MRFGLLRLVRHDDPFSRYVDDMLVGEVSTDLVKEVADVLSSHFLAKNAR